MCGVVKFLDNKYFKKTKKETLFKKKGNPIFKNKIKFSIQIK